MTIAMYVNFQTHCVLAEVNGRTLFFPLKVLI